MSEQKHICMLASENDVIPGGKVGGIGDVVRDIPKALAAEGVTVSVVIPAYGSFHELPSATLVDVCTTRYRGKTERVELYELFPDLHEGVRYFVVHHPLFAAGGKGAVYCDDDASQPFATDANKFALFSIASLSVINHGLLGDIDVLHLHDWHSALASVLIRFDPEFQSLQEKQVVFSIHNLALQGIRPFAQSASSLEAWYPHLHYDADLLSDPRWPHCVNPMASAIRLADKVHTVSPTYAQEVLLPNDKSRGFHGGEGLENDLRTRAEQNNLVGIINGIDYSENHPRIERDAITWAGFLQNSSDELLRIIGSNKSMRSVDYLAHQRLLNWKFLPMPAHVVTSVGRLTDQKMSLLTQPFDNGEIPLQIMLDSIKNRGMLILLGSGDSKLESICQELASKHSHFLFFNTYSQRLSDLLFEMGDLFLMPSSFEPCGISQMLAMRDGQPCLAHAVGGLKDTIDNDASGYLFHGESINKQSLNMLKRIDNVLDQRETQTAEYERISQAASEKKFRWRDSAQRYMNELYT